MWGVGRRVLVAGCRVKGVGCRVQGVGCRVQGVGCTQVAMVVWKVRAGRLIDSGLVGWP